MGSRGQGLTWGWELGRRSDNHVSEVVGVIPIPRGQAFPNQTSPQGLGWRRGQTAPREPVGTLPRASQGRPGW